MRLFLFLSIAALLVINSSFGAGLQKKKDLGELVGDYKQKSKESNDAVESANEDQKAKLLRRQKNGAQPVRKESLTREKEDAKEDSKDETTEEESTETNTTSSKQ